MTLSDKKFGVSAFLLFLSILASAGRAKADASTIPRPEGWVNDFAGVIDSESRSRMNALGQEVKNKTGAELAVVTVRDMGGLPVEDYANRLYRGWGIGDREKNEGALILLAMQERKVRIETGYGLEGLFNDARCGDILDHSVLPEFRQGDYGGGLLAGMRAMGEIIARDRGVTLDGSGATPRRLRGHEGGGSSGFLMIALFILLVILTRGKILYWIFLGSMLGGGGRGGGGFGGGGFGGGFGGFGGGSSGGGGASRGF